MPQFGQYAARTKRDHPAQWRSAANAHQHFGDDADNGLFNKKLLNVAWHGAHGNQQLLFILDSYRNGAGFALVG